MTAPKAKRRRAPSEAERRDKLVSLRLDPETRTRLDSAAEVYGSRSKALRAALDALEGR